MPPTNVNQPDAQSPGSRPAAGDLAGRSAVVEGPSTAPPVVIFEDVSLAFDEHVVLRDLSFSVPKGSMRLLLGASGAGKSVVLKLILGLLCPDAGRIFVKGERIDNMPERDLLRVRTDIGMAFQEIALFDSLTVAQNVGYRLAEESGMPPDRVRARVEEVLTFLGLAEYGQRLPSELSGGQRRRVAIGRSVAGQPSLLLLDDPTTGLDPIIATTIDDGIVKLRDAEHVTSIVATHQIRDAYYLATHHAVRTEAGLEVLPAEASSTRADFMVLHEGRVHFEGSAAELLASEDPYLKEFLFMTLPPW